jgi:hypothetical protein
MRFPNSLRARKDNVTLSQAAGAWTIRVQSAEVWDAVRVVCDPDTSITRIKQAAMAELMPDVQTLDDYEVKLRGALIPNETLSLAAVGGLDASTLFILARRRQPLR